MLVSVLCLAMHLQGVAESPVDATELLAKAEQSYQQSYKRLNGKTEESSKKELAHLTAQYGTAVMNSAALLPFEKYPKALKIYAQALELDPGNQEASQNRQLILDIYESMGKTPPTE